eukprot:CAMPEP_0197601132 /NCGR_PEP_ID=MMETSP1326-20131121/34720_1 /TAXON_ID=1155430 /ORGANISM="Genus nov. species nov., Strain RCC2288" /LENGTH=30 /DNA_ID= /DNA_START= /DNA_END= /DNA_ORIENTATION=
MTSGASRSAAAIPSVVVAGDDQWLEAQGGE